MSVLKLNQIQTASGVIMANLNSSGANVGIQLASNLAPAFFANMGSNQTFSTSSYTKVQMNTEVFDTNGNYDPTTNYRFTPTVAGYYFVTIQIAWVSTVVSPSNAIYKNGSIYSSRYDQGTLTNFYQSHSQLIYLNGSTDYIENYAQISSGSTGTYTGNNSNFQAFLARSA
jgi:hypothetical protein